MKTPAAALALAALLAACTPSSINPRDSKLAALSPGITSRDQVLAELGQPKTVVRFSDGSRALIYDYAQLSTEPPPREPAFPWQTRPGGVRTASICLAFDTRDTLRYWAADGTGRGQ